MKMVDMARPKPKKSNKEEAPVMAESYDKYPYCLRITFQNEELKSLNLKTRDFKLGENIVLTCNAEVISIRESEEVNQKKDQSVEIQIKGIGFEKHKKTHNEMVDDADKLLKGMKGK